MVELEDPWSDTWRSIGGIASTVGFGAGASDEARGGRRAIRQKVLCPYQARSEGHRSVTGRNVGLDGHGARTNADACLPYVPFGLLPYMHDAEELE